MGALDYHLQLLREGVISRWVNLRVTKQRYAVTIHPLSRSVVSMTRPQPFGTVLIAATKARLAAMRRRSVEAVRTASVVCDCHRVATCVGRLHTRKDRSPLAPSGGLAVHVEREGRHPQLGWEDALHNILVGIAVQ